MLTMFGMGTASAGAQAFKELARLPDDNPVDAYRVRHDNSRRSWERQSVLHTGYAEFPVWTSDSRIIPFS